MSQKTMDTILGFAAGTSIGTGVIIFTNMFLKRGNCMGEDLVWKFANRLILNDDVPKEMKDLIEKEKLKFVDEIRPKTWAEGCNPNINNKGVIR